MCQGNLERSPQLTEVPSFIGPEINAFSQWSRWVDLRLQTMPNLISSGLPRAGGSIRSRLPCHVSQISRCGSRYNHPRDKVRLMSIKSNSNYTTLSGESRGAGVEAFKPYSYSYLNSFNQNSINHAAFPNRLGSTLDVGGPWFMEKTAYDIRGIERNDNLCHGPQHGTAVTTWTSQPDLTIVDSAMVADGTKAIGKTAPSNPAFNLSRSVGEIAREGVPRLFGSGLVKEKARFLKGSGSEYLNVEFGWKPIVSDLRALANTIKHQNKVIENYRKGSMSVTRRRHAFDPVNVTRTTNGGVAMRPTSPSAIWPGSTYESRDTRAWFSGAFRYFVPVDDDLMGKLKSYESMANKLLGVRITPDVVWNLTPWTWMTDWFANTGDILLNISNLGSDSTVMQYGYVMRTVTTELTTSWTVPPDYVPSQFAYLRRRNGYFRRTNTKKKRIPASPYGFVTAWDGLSNRQLAICAALGVTRVR